MSHPICDCQRRRLCRWGRATKPFFITPWSWAGSWRFRTWSSSCSRSNLGPVIHSWCCHRSWYWGSRGHLPCDCSGRTLPGSVVSRTWSTWCSIRLYISISFSNTPCILKILYMKLKVTPNKIILLYLILHIAVTGQN